MCVGVYVCGVYVCVCMRGVCVCVCVRGDVYYVRGFDGWSGG